jgi:hypothetical protein
VQEKFHHVEASCSSGDVVRDVDEIAAGGASNSVFDSTVFIPLLVYDRVVVNNVSKAIDGNGEERHGEQSAGGDKARNFLSFSDDSEVAVGAGFCRGLREGYPVNIQVKGEG